MRISGGHSSTGGTSRGSPDMSKLVCIHHNWTLVVSEAGPQPGPEAVASVAQLTQILPVRHNPLFQCCLVSNSSVVGIRTCAFARVLRSPPARRAGARGMPPSAHLMMRFAVWRHATVSWLRVVGVIAIDAVGRNHKSGGEARAAVWVKHHAGARIANRRMGDYIAGTKAANVINE